MGETMGHFLLWATLIIGAILVGWALMGNGGGKVWNSYPLYFCIIMFLMGISLCVIYGIKIFHHFFG